MSENFLEWLPPCIGKLGYQTLGIPSTEIHMAVINLNITAQRATDDLEGWVAEWLT